MISCAAIAIACHSHAASCANNPNLLSIVYFLVRAIEQMTPAYLRGAGESAIDNGVVKKNVLEYYNYALAGLQGADELIEIVELLLSNMVISGIPPESAVLIGDGEFVASDGKPRAYGAAPVPKQCDGGLIRISARNSMEATLITIHEIGHGLEFVLRELRGWRDPYCNNASEMIPIAFEMHAFLYFLARYDSDRAWVSEIYRFICIRAIQIAVNKTTIEAVHTPGGVRTGFVAHLDRVLGAEPGTFARVLASFTRDGNVAQLSSGVSRNVNHAAAFCEATLMNGPIEAMQIAMIRPGKRKNAYGTINSMIKAMNYSIPALVACAASRMHNVEHDALPERMPIDEVTGAHDCRAASLQFQYFQNFMEQIESMKRALSEETTNATAPKWASPQLNHQFRRA
jgi:hypothetical protein